MDNQHEAAGLRPDPTLQRMLDVGSYHGQDQGDTVTAPTQNVPQEQPAQDNLVLELFGSDVDESTNGSAQQLQDDLQERVGHCAPALNQSTNNPTQSETPNSHAQQPEENLGIYGACFGQEVDRDAPQTNW